MKKITVSAPGKLMLFGEHAVIYNHPCIVTAVGQRMMATVEKTNDQLLYIDAPDVEVKNYSKDITKIGKGEMPKGVRFIEKAVELFFKKNSLNCGLSIKTSSEFTSEFGFGSSAASTVCVLKALSELFKKPFTNKELFNLAYEVVLAIQGKGSGFDIAASIYGGTLYFVTGGKTIEPLTISSLPLTVIYSGVKADTVTLVNKVAELKKNNPELVDGLFKNIEDIVKEAKPAIEKQDWKKVGELMEANQLYLDQLEIMTDKLSHLLVTAKMAGSLGAKISGAGGGDCIIALSPSHKNEINKALKLVKAQILPVETSVEGVRIET